MKVWWCQSTWLPYFLLCGMIPLEYGAIIGIKRWNLDDGERSITRLLSGHVDTSLNTINTLGLTKEVSVIKKGWFSQPWNSPQWGKKRAKPVLDSQYLAMRVPRVHVAYWKGQYQPVCQLLKGRGHLSFRFTVSSLPQSLDHSIKCESSWKAPGIKGSRNWRP